MIKIKISKDGFSLLEMMIAMVIAAIMFMGIYAVSIQSLQILRAARDETRAVHAAQYELEKLRSYSWSVLENMAALTTFSSADNIVLGRLNSSSGSIRKTLHQPHNIVEPIYAVSITVFWNEYNGLQTSRTVTSLITERGMIK